MSQPFRRLLIAAGLAAALLLAVPAPSRAAALREPALSLSLMDRVWSWLESLLPGAAAPRSAARPESSTFQNNGEVPPVKPGPPPPSSDQGSMIDPDGRP